MKSISINGVAVVTNDGEGRAMFEFLPDDPQGQQLAGFHSGGSGQLMRDGTFHFTGTEQGKGEQSAMKRKYEMSYFLAPITNKIPQRTVTLVEVAEMIRSTRLMAQTAALRAIGDLAEARRYKGWHFPYVTTGGVFSYCNDQSLVRHSNVLCMDLDHLEDVSGLKQRLIADKQFRTLMAFRSPSGDGLKWLIEIDLTKCGHEQWFDAVRMYLMQTYGLTARQADPSVRNVSRACFLCYDPEVYLNPELMTADR